MSAIVTKARCRRRQQAFADGFITGLAAPSMFIAGAFRQGLRSKAGSALVAGFTHGLAQMGSFASAGSLVNYPKAGDDAIRGDWQRVGGDLQKGLGKVRRGEKAKA